VFVEKHPTEAEILKETLGRRKHVSVLAEDGYVALKTLPPKENRGLVLIDPPYEIETEFADVARSLQMALTRWPNGMYCVWYPIKPGHAEQRLHRTLVEAGIKKMLVLELGIRPSDSPLGLNGSGLLIVNPPYQLDEQMRTLLPQLHRALVPEQSGGVRVDWLAGE
jgi:23S rRNA (adenine2030-N6)-methyltransferase